MPARSAITSGVFDANGQTTTVTGLTKINGGAYHAGSATQSFGGGLSLTSGSFTGAGGIVSVTGTALVNIPIGGVGDFSVSGTAIVSKNIASTGTQSYGGALCLTGNVVFSSTGTAAAGDITFASTIQSPSLKTLTVDTAGTTRFNGAVGGSGKPLGGVTTDAAGATQINGGSVNTGSNSQTYNDAVTLGGDTTLTASLACFHGNLTLGSLSSSATRTLSINGKLTATGATLTSTIAGANAGQFGRVVATGSVNLNSEIYSVNYNEFNPTPGESFDVIDTGSGFTAKFTNVVEPGPVNLGGKLFADTYSGGTGNNDLVLSTAVAPHINSPSATTFTVGSFGSFQMTATGAPAPTFSVPPGSLPLGVTLSTSGVLSGIPAPGTAGMYTFTVTASNGVHPNATQSFTLTVLNNSSLKVAYPPMFVSIGGGKTAGVFTIVNTGQSVLSGPVTIGFPALPSQVSIFSTTSIKSLAPGKSASVIVVFNNPSNYYLGKLQFFFPAVVRPAVTYDSREPRMSLQIRGSITPPLQALATPPFGGKRTFAGAS